MTQDRTHIVYGLPRQHNLRLSLLYPTKYLFLEIILLVHSWGDSSKQTIQGYGSRRLASTRSNEK